MVLLFFLGEAVNQARRSSTFATLKGVGKYMARPLTSEHISAGTLEKGLSSATGCSVAKDSQGAMSFRGTEGPTQVSCLSQAAAVLFT